MQYKALLYRKQALIEASFELDNQAMIDPKKDKHRSDNSALARKIADAIEDSPLSAKEIASRCGVTPQAANGWKTTGRISKEMLGTLADVLGLPLSHFISAGRSREQRLALASDSDDDAVVTADEIIELISAYKSASKRDRKSVMDSAKFAAERAAIRDDGIGVDESQ